MHQRVITIADVGHSYGTGALRTQVLFDVSAKVHAGEVVLLTGPSGSGKTTLLTLIGCLRTVQDGSLVVLGEELRGAPETTCVALRRRMGWIFQLHNLLRALTALQNVKTGLVGETTLDGAAADRRARELLARVGLERHALRHPDELSVGQRQRVAVARALAARPSLVLADEPTAALDRQSGRAVVEALRTLAKEHGTAVLLVTHDDRIFDIGDRVLRMEEGRLEPEPSFQREGMES
jgi:putative ABC transport system ATP-binding protein